MRRINALLLVAIFALSIFAAPLAALAQGGEPAEIVAKVNGVAITRERFLELLEAEYGFFALQELIQRELVRQKAEELQVTVDEQEFAETYELITAQFGGPANLQLMLAQNGLSEAQFQDQIRFSMLVTALTKAEVQVSEEELLRWFEENRRFYDQPFAVEVSHILVETEELARELLAQLENGADLAALAQEHSLDPGTAPQGGYLGLITEGLTVPEFEEAAFSLDIGGFGLAESTYGWHVITVHSKQEAKAADFAAIAQQVEADFRRSKALDFQSYMYKLEQEADLEVLWEPR
ncbi:MAG TPA: peptidylprolyl isomerase [Limnochordia bacterium]|nr:peptidylprolyl isomerase [Limnochordia bacterium]